MSSTELTQSMAQLEALGHNRCWTITDAVCWCLMTGSAMVATLPGRYPLSWDGVYYALVAIGHRGTAENMHENSTG